MVGMYVFFLAALIMCRFIAGYDSRFQNGKYIVIKSPILRKILIDKTSFGERRNRLKKDINKMSVWGLALYICAVVTFAIGVLLNFVVPKIPIEPWIRETNKLFVYADTLNEKLTVIFIWIFIVTVFLYLMIFIVGYNKKTEPKRIKILIFVVAGIALVAAIFVLFEMIRELVLSFTYLL